LNWSIAWVEVMAKRDKRWTTPDDERLLKFNDAGTPVCTESVIRVDEVTESLKLAE
jgi:hypothetical protein